MAKAIKYGMKGDDVKNLQTTLNNLGYNLDVDGSFGSQTLSAVKQYQQKNGLTVDGMVGPQTQAKLFGGGSNKTSATTGPIATDPGSSDPGSSAPTITAPGDTGASKPANAPNSAPGTGSALPTGTEIMYPDDFTYDDYQSSGAVNKAVGDGFSYDDFSYGPYQASETVTQAQAALDAILAAQPGAYESKWQGQINEMIDRILNREKFTYDINSDALYQQYADQYKNLGKLAMQDTMGQAAAMTGGYGSSYAQSVGQQAYQGYLSQLNEMVPELYGMALDQYNREGQEMYNQYGLLSDQEQQDYGRYRDSYNQWLAERDYATGRYDSERNFDYGKYVDDRNFDYGVYVDDRNQDYNEYVNAIELAKWQETDEYTKYLNNRGQAWNEHLTKIDQANTQAEFLEDQRRYNTSRQDDLNSETKAYAREDVMTVLSAGGDVTDEELAAAGMSRKVADAVKVISSATNSSSSVAEEAALKHVGTMSSKDIIDTLEFYAADGNNTAIEALLDDAFMTERIDEATYLDWKKKYLRTNSRTTTDTTVAALGGPTGSGAGGGGLAGNNMVK
jgi:peptidoglycan hydrolase-like protein with peptidoglycan-binding domain